MGLGAIITLNPQHLAGATLKLVAHPFHGQLISLGPQPFDAPVQMR